MYQVAVEDKMGNGKDYQVPAVKQAADMLQDFVAIFKSRGWLNQAIRIKHRENKYRISCSETGFIAYRVNDYLHVSPGIPGWPVCFVASDRIVNDSEMSKFESTEPSAHDWLRCIASGDLELI